MFTRFKKNTDGNVAMMFGVSTLMLVVGIGAAVDYGSVSSRQQMLQDMVDAAALTAARAGTNDQIELQAIADEVIREHNNSNYDIRLEVSVVDNQVFIKGLTTYDTHIMGIAGKPHMNVSASAGSPIAGSTPVKIALVLDNTESMMGDDLIALKSASNGLLDELEKFEAPVAVSIVPFGQYVNVGTSRKHASWLDVSQDGTTETDNHCYDHRAVITPRMCTKTGKLIDREIIRDGRSFGFEQIEETTCTAAVREAPVEICELRTQSYTWHGCVGSRQSPYNEQAAFNLKPIMGVMNKTCGAELQELSTSFTASRLTLNTMSAVGNTYLPSGVAWGWRTLQNEEPLNTNVNLKIPNGVTSEPAKVMIFMTDGKNTLSQGGSEPHLHDSRNEAEANKRTLALCDGAKSDAIQIYTIGYRLQDASDEVKTVLQTCASSPAHYFDASNAEQLKETFRELAGKLDFTRLSI